MSDTPTLLIDHAATARRLDESEVRDWAADQRVFVSSVIEGYEEPRSAAAVGVEAAGAEPVLFERFGGRDSNPHQAYLNEVASSSIYVGLLGARYGVPLPSRFSATHAEYRHAEQRGLRLSIWVEEGVDREGPQQSFLDEVRQFNVTGRFANADELTDNLKRRLAEIAAEDLSPWCKLGDTIFRAREIQIGARTGVVEATIRDEAIARTLLAANEMMGRGTTTFAYWGGVYDADIKDVSTVSRSSGSRSFRLELDLAPPNTPMKYSMNGMSWEQMTELAVRVSWFGEDNPMGMMAGSIELENPFRIIADLSLPEEALRPIARVLATEVLTRAREVSRINRFRLGPPVAGNRLLALEWVPTRQYANEPEPAPQAVEGMIPWASSR